MKIADSVDVLVVGSGFAGLLAASFSIKKGKKVLLIDSHEEWGGRYSPKQRDGYTLGAGFAFSNGDLYRQVFDRLELPLEALSLANGSGLMHSARGWTSFEAEDIPAWESYLSHPTPFYPVGGFYGVQKRLLDFCKASSLFSMHLGLPLTNIEVHDGKVTNAVLGSNKSIKPETVIWAGGFKGLLEVLNGDATVPEAGAARVSWLRKFSKTVATPGVVLEFAHKQKVSDFTETLLLPFSHGEKEEARHLVGAFIGNRDPSLVPEGKQLSTWIFPLTEAEWGENHETMKKIRAAHRLLDKAFAGFESSIEFDRVLVLDSTITPQTKRKGDWHPVLQNLLVASDWAAPHGAHNEGILDLMLEKF